MPPVRTMTRRWAIVSLMGCWMLLGTACTGDDGEIHIAGRTMGTGYSVKLLGAADPSAVQVFVDSILAAINAEVNTYDYTSLIRRLNAGERLELPVVVEPLERQAAPGAHLAANLALAYRPYLLSGGAFDPTVGPLVEYYGFGARAADTSAVDTAEVNRLLELVGLDKIQLDTQGTTIAIGVAAAGVALDLSAIAKGYAVDQVALGLAERFEVADYFVEIGG